MTCAFCCPSHRTASAPLGYSLATQPQTPAFLKRTAIRLDVEPTYATSTLRRIVQGVADIMPSLNRATQNFFGRLIFGPDQVRENVVCPPTGIGGPEIQTHDRAQRRVPTHHFQPSTCKCRV